MIEELARAVRRGSTLPGDDPERNRPDLTISRLNAAIWIMSHGVPICWYFGNNQQGQLVATTDISKLADTERELLIGDISKAMTVDLAGYVHKGVEMEVFCPLMITDASGLVPDLKRDSITVSGTTALHDNSEKTEGYRGEIFINLTRFMEAIVNNSVHFINIKDPRANGQDNLIMIMPDPDSKVSGHLLAFFFMSPNLPGVGNTTSSEILSSCLGVFIDKIASSNTIYQECLNSIRARKDYPPIHKDDKVEPIGLRMTLVKRLAQRANMLFNRGSPTSIDEKYWRAHLNDARIANEALARLLRIDNPYLRQKLYELYALAHVYTQLPIQQLELLQASGKLASKSLLEDIMTPREASLANLVTSDLIVPPDWRRVRDLLGIVRASGLPLRPLSREQLPTRQAAVPELAITVITPDQEQTEMMRLRDSFLHRLGSYIEQTDINDPDLAAHLLVGLTRMLDSRQSPQVHRLANRIFSRIESETLKDTRRRTQFIFALRSSIEKDGTAWYPLISRDHFNSGDVDESLVSIIHNIPLDEIDSICNSINSRKKQLTIHELYVIESALKIVERSLPLVGKRVEVLQRTQDRLQEILAGKSSLLTVPNREVITHLIASISNIIQSQSDYQRVIQPRDLISYLPHRLDGAMTEFKRPDFPEVGVYPHLRVDLFIEDIYHALYNNDPYAIDELLDSYFKLNYLNPRADIFSFPFPQDLSVKDDAGRLVEIQRFRQEAGQVQFSPGQPLNIKQLERLRLAIPQLIMIDRLAVLGRDSLDGIYRDPENVSCWDYPRLCYALKSLSRMEEDAFYSSFSTASSRYAIWYEIHRLCFNNDQKRLLSSADVVMARVFNRESYQVRDAICADLLAEVIQTAGRYRSIFSYLSSESIFRRTVVDYLTSQTDHEIDLIPRIMSIDTSYGSDQNTYKKIKNSVINNLRAIKDELLSNRENEKAARLDVVIDSLQ